MFGQSPLEPRRKAFSASFVWLHPCLTASGMLYARSSRIPLRYLQTRGNPHPKGKRFRAKGRGFPNAEGGIESPAKVC